MLPVPGLLALKPFHRIAADAQVVVRLDACMREALERAAPHRLARLPAAAPPQRRLEYLASRAAAQALLQAQGCAGGDVTNAADRSPRWPAGFTGSISHSAALACVVVRPAAQCLSVGIDAQELLDAQGAADVAGRCLHPRELDGLRAAGMPERELLTLAFCAKEAFFKCVYPLAGRHFGPLDAQLHAIDPGAGLLQVRIVRSPGPALPDGYTMSGGFSLAIGHAFAAFELGAGGRPSPPAQAPTGM